jgi:hypothetical protein
MISVVIIIIAIIIGAIFRAIIKIKGMDKVIGHRICQECIKNNTPMCCSREDGEPCKEWRRKRNAKDPRACDYCHYYVDCNY